MLFDHCAQCQRCCHVDADYPPLEVTLTRQEKKIYGKVCIETRCDHLGPAGCNLGEAKPVSCKLYPLSFDHKANAYYFDAGCPLLPEYQRQLKNPDSEASQHLKEMDQLLQQLIHTDEDFLKRNREVDLDFFELTPLAKPTFLANKS